MFLPIFIGSVFKQNLCNTTISIIREITTNEIAIEVAMTADAIIYLLLEVPTSVSADKVININAKILLIPFSLLETVGLLNIDVVIAEGLDVVIVVV